MTGISILFQDNSYTIYAFIVAALCTYESSHNIYTWIKGMLSHKHMKHPESGYLVLTTMLLVIMAIRLYMVACYDTIPVMFTKTMVMLRIIPPILVITLNRYIKAHRYWNGL